MAHSKMMTFLRRLAPLLVAGLVGGCGVSSLTDPAFQTQGLGTQESAAAAANSSGQMVPASGITSEAGKKSHSSARKAARKLTAVAKPGSVSYRIGPQDVLSVSVFKVAELSKTVQVSEAGTVNMPLIGEVKAAGRTARDMEHEFAKKWGAKYLQNPQVTVLVKEYNSQRITLDGAVKKPGVLPIKGSMTLLQAVATVGGLNANASSTVVVFREQSGKRKAARFDISEIRNGTARDPSLQAGDVVVASTSAMKVTLNNVLKILPVARVFTIF